MNKNVSLALFVAIALLSNSVFGFGKPKAPSAMEIAMISLEKVESEIDKIKNNYEKKLSRLDKITINNPTLDKASNDIIESIKIAMLEPRKKAASEIYPTSKETVDLDETFFELAEAKTHHNLVTALIKSEILIKKTLNDIDRKINSAEKLHKQATVNLIRSAELKAKGRKLKADIKAAAEKTKAKAKEFGITAKAKLQKTTDTGITETTVHAS
jgi:hypothetical protein